VNKRPGHVNVTVETGYCNFCGRTRNLRREEHQLGALVRTIITCETCHRTLSSSVGVAAVEPEPSEAPAAPAAVAEPPTQPEAKAPAAVKTPAKAQARAAMAKAPAKLVAKPQTATAKPAALSAKTAKTKTPAKRAPTKKK